MMYAVVRKDLEMPPGKLAAQAGHAYTESLFDCLERSPDLARRYRNKENAGSKVALYAKSLEEIVRLKAFCEANKIPHALFEDDGHVLPPHFDGSPIITSLGIGPVRRADAKPILKKLKCV